MLASVYYAQQRKIAFIDNDPYTMRLLKMIELRLASDELQCTIRKCWTDYIFFFLLLLDA